MTDQIGICQQSYAVYEGDHTGVRLQHPPILTPIRYFTGGDTPELKKILGLPELIFREDDFDPVTKIRRGRVYTGNGSQPTEWKVHDDSLSRITAQPHGYGMACPIRLFTYRRENLFHLQNKTSLALPSVILGEEPHLTFWKIVSIETNLFGTPILTLRAKYTYGDTPELIENEIPQAIQQRFFDAVSAVEASVNRLAPTDVIDRCRAVLSIAFGYHAGDLTKDLGPAISAYLKIKYPNNDTKEDVCSRCGDIIAKLHSRSKHNEQIKLDLRTINDGDALLALECLRFVLVEFGWAR